MTDLDRLFLYEEIMLLALRDEKGTVVTSFSEYAVAGAVLAERQLVSERSLNEAPAARVRCCEAWCC
jgi:hypothetical protein